MEKAPQKRIARSLTWQRHFGLYTDQGICPSCDTSIIYKDEWEGPLGWEGGHMIPSRTLKVQNIPNHLINMAPICLKCNVADKKFKSNFHYRASINRMTSEMADWLFDKTLRQLIELGKNPSLNICTWSVLDKKTGYYRQCTRQRFQDDNVCAECSKTRQRAREKESKRNLKIVNIMILNVQEIAKSRFDIDDSTRFQIGELKTKLDNLLDGSISKESISFADLPSSEISEPEKPFDQEVYDKISQMK